MKKSLIATGAASLALAAMPVLGAFADVTDTVRITINSSCSVGGDTATTGSGVTLTETMANGATKTWDADGTAGGKLMISCNDAGARNITAVGTGADATNKNYMNAATTGTDIATGEATSGATSNWAFKLAGTGVVSNYTSFRAVPASATKVATSTDPAASVVINTGYRVFVSATQEADTYEGKVTYTVAQGA